MTRLRWKVFDDQSQRLDQFGVLLIAALIAVVALSLVDLTPNTVDEVPWGSLAVTGYVVLLFILAMSATGVAYRWRRGTSIVLTIGYLATSVLTVTARSWAPPTHP